MLFINPLKHSDHFTVILIGYKIQKGVNHTKLWPKKSLLAWSVYLGVVHVVPRKVFVSSVNLNVCYFLVISCFFSLSVETLNYEVTDSSPDSLELNVHMLNENFYSINYPIPKWLLSTQIQGRLMASVLTVCRPVSLGRSDDPHLSYDPDLVFF